MAYTQKVIFRRYTGHSYLRQKLLLTIALSYFHVHVAWHFLAAWLYGTGMKMARQEDNMEGVGKKAYKVNTLNGMIMDCAFYTQPVITEISSLCLVL